MGKRTPSQPSWSPLCTLILTPVQYSLREPRTEDPRESQRIRSCRRGVGKLSRLGPGRLPFAKKTGHGLPRQVPFKCHTVFSNKSRTPFGLGLGGVVPRVYFFSDSEVACVGVPDEVALKYLRALYPQWSRRLSYTVLQSCTYCTDCSTVVIISSF